MNSLISPIDCALGDLVLFNGVALFHQTKFSSGALSDDNVGLILKKIEFSESGEFENDCQQVVDSDLVIQEPKFVYTLLCQGSIIEVLDIDINKVI